MNDIDIIDISGFTLRTNPVDKFLVDLAMREGQMTQLFFSRVLNAHFDKSFLELYMLDRKQIPGLSMNIKGENTTQEGAAKVTANSIAIYFRDKRLGSCRIVHKHYPELLVVSLIDAKIETCSTQNM